MHARWFAILALPAALAAYGSPASAQAPAGAAIDQPVEGQILRGSIEFVGTAAIPDFASADLSFSYARDATNTWFTIVEIDRPVIGSQLGTWDTTAISDGDYVLRLQVHGQAGSTVEATVDVQVRNYTAPDLPTATVTATSSPVARVPTAIILPISVTPTSTRAMPPTSTPLPANPVAVSETAVYGTFARGALVAAVLGAIVALATLRRRT
jgi:hypothetical protein